MRIYKKNTLIYKIRVWMILYLGVIQTLNYVILGIVMKDEKAAFRTICVMGCLSCGLFVHLVINDFQRDSSGNGLLTEIITYIGSILAVGEFLSEFWFVTAGGIETIIVLLGIVAILQKQKNINDGKRKPNRKK
ncbi:MAG: hypothetical protein V8T85_06835 [Blautia faecicola]|jgi:hypothetical protein|uniref:hypothetical protein n=1 Tax=Blautia TaxID=572511 RepID=UPI00033D12F1|nr:hypothetical protein [Blautia sp.]MBN2928254.1 hypothetical protein [Eubacterium sp.]CDD98801.1 unknown [Roseburia sp. CAG:471]